MAAAEPRLEVLHGYVLDKVYKRGNCVTGARFSRGGGDRLEVSARITVDATDLGDALPMSGTPYRIGMDARADTGETLAPAEANDIVQDLTFCRHPQGLRQGCRQDHPPAPKGYDPAEFAAACQTAAGQPISAEAMLNYGRLPNGKYMLNWPVNGNDVYMNIVEVPCARRDDAALRPPPARRPCGSSTISSTNWVSATWGSPMTSSAPRTDWHTCLTTARGGAWTG